MVELIIKGQWYLFYLLGIMIVSGYARDLNLFYPIYNFIAKSFKSNRFIVFLISCVTGVLPIPGRVTVSAGVLNTIAPKEKEKRKVYGIIDYLSTHHYYLWSPIEKSVIIPMAVLGISYWQFMYHMIPLLIITFVVILYYIFYVLKEDDVEIRIEKYEKDKKVEKNPFTYVDWYTVLFLAVIIVGANFAREYTDQIKTIVSANVEHFALVSVIAFTGSLILGSSSRFAAITAICVGLYGIEYLPWFFAIDYAGYMLSPTHKCLFIGKSYFGTDLYQYYKSIFILCSALILVALLQIIVI